MIDIATITAALKSELERSLRAEGGWCEDRGANELYVHGNIDLTALAQAVQKAVKP